MEMRSEIGAGWRGSNIGEGTHCESGDATWKGLIPGFWKFRKAGHRVRKTGQIAALGLYFVRKAGIGAAGRLWATLLFFVYYPININELLLIPNR